MTTHTRKLSDIMRKPHSGGSNSGGSNSGGANSGGTHPGLRPRPSNEVELPDVFPTIEEFAILFWGDPMDLRSPAVPMKMHITSADTSTGQLCGWAMPCPSIDFRGPNGQKMEVPALLPQVGVPYSTSGRKMTWCRLADFKAMIDAQVRAAARDIQREQAAQAQAQAQAQAPEQSTEQAPNSEQNPTSTDSNSSTGSVGTGSVGANTFGEGMRLSDDGRNATEEKTSGGLKSIDRRASKGKGNFGLG